MTLRELGVVQIMKLFLRNFLHLPVPLSLLDQNISVAYMSIYGTFTAFILFLLSYPSGAELLWQKGMPKLHIVE
jgi:hypothetical protein